VQERCIGKLPACHFRHHDIREEQRDRPVALDELQGFNRIRSGEHRVTELAQSIDGEGAHARFVFDDQDYFIVTTDRDEVADRAL
jgi:hypothetical protein